VSGMLLAIDNILPLYSLSALFFRRSKNPRLDLMLLWVG
jgi:hypothetical protein